jgi:FKBP-type peptidyl-prolyl cis-trans isomerase FkpA
MEREGPMRSTITLAVALLLAAGCGGETRGVAGGPGDVARSYAPELNVDLNRMERTETGLRYEDMREGTGAEAMPGQIVTVHYTGWLPDGTQFDSSRDHDQPFQTPIGVGRVIPGWDEGIPGMRVGGQRKLVIPPALAYGERGAGGVIPANATLVFDVELLDVR